MIALLLWIGELISAGLALAWAVAKLLGVLATMVGIFELVCDPKGKERIGWLLRNIVEASIDVAAPLLGAVESQLVGVAQRYVNAATSNGGEIAAVVREPVAGLVRTELRDVESALKAIGESTADNSSATAAAAMANAFGFGMSSAVVTAVFEAAFPEKLNSLNGAGPMLAKMAGFDEVAKAVREPLYEAAFGQSLKYHYRSIFKPELPSEKDAVTWHSRGLLTDDQLRAIFNFSGLKPEYETAFITSAYRPVSPFILARAASTGAISNADLRDAMVFNGMRPADIERMITALDDLAVDPYRKQALAAFVSAAERGLYSGPDIDAELDALNVIPAARPYLEKAIAYKRLETLADLYRKSISDAYKYGQVSDAQYVPLLEQGGLNQADAAAHYEIDSIVLKGKEAASAARAAAKLDGERTRAAVQAAMEQYRDGVIDAPGLALALAAAGLDPQIGASLVALAVARANASAVYVFGLRLTRDKAILLREKVAAIAEDVKKKLMDATAALDTLASFGIPRANAAALVAAWTAQGFKQVLTP